MKLLKKISTLCAALAVSAASLAPQAGYFAAAVAGTAALTSQDAHAESGYRVCGIAQDYTYYVFIGPLPTNYSSRRVRMSAITKVRNGINCSANNQMLQYVLSNRREKLNREFGSVEYGPQENFHGATCENVSRNVGYAGNDICKGEKMREGIQYYTESGARGWSIRLAIQVL